MKAVLRAFAWLALAASLVLPISVHAADKVALTAGAVKKIDVASNRIMLAHGPIENLFMPPMTMMFNVKDVAMLKKVKDGDKVLFRAEDDVKGGYVIVSIEVVKK